MNGWKRRWMRLARDKVLSLISLATKAGRCASGEFMTEGQTKSGRASLVVVAEDASDNTKKKFRDMCKFYKVPMIVYGDKAVPCIPGNIGRRICKRNIKRTEIPYLMNGSRRQRFPVDCLKEVDLYGR